MSGFSTVFKHPPPAAAAAAAVPACNFSKVSQLKQPFGVSGRHAIRNNQPNKQTCQFKCWESIVVNLRKLYSVFTGSITCRCSHYCASHFRLTTLTSTGGYAGPEMPPCSSRLYPSSVFYELSSLYGTFGDENSRSLTDVHSTAEVTTSRKQVETLLIGLADCIPHNVSTQIVASGVVPKTPPRVSMNGDRALEHVYPHPSTNQRFGLTVYEALRLNSPNSLLTIR
ncbi:unnamed protein product [Mesocestoides corti]|uniref:Uncharacterized protein n=1 Tax=Mesocestoides corti TaxID=53468 RepID=A0A0R3UR10_MESCO|nr:unnamed protein product [Mesocestoides corti]